MAHGLGAVDILYLPIIGHGYTQWKRGGPVIHLSLSRSDGRRRFLLAHECGHLLFDRMLADEPHRAWTEFGLDVDDHDGLEWACNEYANELLIPSGQLRAARACLFDLDLLREAATIFRVSLTALIFRLNRIGNTRTFLTVRYTFGGEWVVVDRIGAPAEWRGSVDLGRSSQLALTSQVPTERCTSMTLELLARQRSAFVSSQVRLSSTRQHAIALFDAAQLSL